MAEPGEGEVHQDQDASRAGEKSGLETSFPGGVSRALRWLGCRVESGRPQEVEPQHFKGWYYQAMLGRQGKGLEGMAVSSEWRPPAGSWTRSLDWKKSLESPQHMTMALKSPQLDKLSKGGPWV